MKGKLKIKGNMQAATKFTPEVFMKPKLWYVHIRQYLLLILFFKKAIDFELEMSAVGKFYNQ